MRVWHVYRIEDVIEIKKKNNPRDPLAMLHGDISCRIMTLSKSARFPRIWKLFGWPEQTILRLGSKEDSAFPDKWHILDGYDNIAEDESKRLWRKYYYSRDAIWHKKEILRLLAESVIEE